MSVSRGQVMAILSQVMDPEIPVVSVVELGVIRDIEFEGDEVRVVMTPTYCGCPAFEMMQQNVIAALKSAGIEKPATKTVLAPAWTTDWISQEAREKLRAYGIAPPHDRSLGEVSPKQGTVPCPSCGSQETELRSEFGSTACKALHYCNDCRQPFEHFKCI